MEITLLPGSSAGLRASAAHLRSTLTDLDTAHRAALQIEAITDGDHWRGEAFDAFRSVTDRKPLPSAILRARGHMEEAASRLDWLAARFDDNQQTLRWCRARLAGLDCTSPEYDAERTAIERDAARAWDDHRSALGSVADLFDRLDDEPVFATPPPSLLERVAGGAGSLAYGFYEGTRDLVVGTVELAIMFNPVMLPFTLQKAWNNRDEIRAVLDFARNDPLGFLAVLGRSMLDLDMLFEDPARWLGRRIPDILLTLATGGLGRVGTTAATSVRGLRGAVVADAALGRAGLLGRAGPYLGAVDTSADAAGNLRSWTLMGRLNRLDADPDRLVRVDGGAFHRDDTLLGSLGARLDQLGPAVAIGRQIPGRINDEIKGVTSIPFRLAGIESPIAQRTFDTLVTDGLTGQLGIADGLLVGSSALSPAAQASMVGVLGVAAADAVSEPLDVYRDVRDHAVRAN